MGLDRTDALAIVEDFSPRALPRRIVTDTEPVSIMENLFPSVRCRDAYACEGFPVLEEDVCNGPAELDLFERVRRAVGTSAFRRTEFAGALTPHVNC